MHGHYIILFAEKLLRSKNLASKYFVSEKIRFDSFVLPHWAKLTPQAEASWSMRPS